MSSKADDFDVRYRDVRNGRSWADGTDGDYAGGDYQALASHGVLKSAVDYDLGYDANGWDTQGFRRPEAGYLDDKDTGHPDGGQAGGPDAPVTDYLGDGDAGTARRRGNGPAASHARTADLQDLEQLSWEPDPSGSTGPWLPERPGRRGRRDRHGAAGQTWGPGNRGRDRSPVKVPGSWWRHWTWRKALGVLLGGIGALIVLGAIAVAVAYEQTPVPTDAMAAVLYSQSVVTYDNSNQVIGTFGTTDRKLVTYNQLAQDPWVINAVLAAEDRHFWTEGGISPVSIVRAAWDDVTDSGGSLQGGSTITQQFVRNYYSGIGTQQTAGRKIKEILVAMKVAREKSKPWILTNYLNTIYLGEGAYGIGAAAQTYFNEPVQDLTPAQAAVIAAIIQQPSLYPLPQYRAQLEARWRYVLGGLVQMGRLTPAQAATLKFPKLLDAAPQSVGPDPWDPYILAEVQNELRSVYGYTPAQIDNGGLKIETTISRPQMVALYQAVQANEQQMAAGGEGMQWYMHVGAVLENPATGAIEAMYAGPGENMSKSRCKAFDCDMNTTLTREQVGSSFKPYVLATAVSQGMNVQTSTLNGFSPLWVPPDSSPTLQNTYSATSAGQAVGESYEVTNDGNASYGGVSVQLATAASVNTAYTDLIHKVGTANVVKTAQALGVNTASILQGGSNLINQIGQAGMALGTASLSVTEQATMLAAVDDNGTYHSAHVIQQITQGNVVTPAKVTTRLVLNPSPTVNAEEDSQIQYAMSEDDTAEGTAPTAALSNGQEIIAKTGTTETAQSAFFIGAIPDYAMAVGIFSDDQTGDQRETLNNLGGLASGGYGGTWPAAIWHTFAENQWVPRGIEQFQPVTFTGSPWNQVPPGLRQHPKKHKKRSPVTGFPVGFPTPPPGNPFPYPTYSCDPQVVTCNPNSPPFGGGNTQTVNATAAGAAVGGAFTALPATCLWVRRRMRKRGAKRG